MEQIPSTTSVSQVSHDTEPRVKEREPWQQEINRLTAHIDAQNQLIAELTKTVQAMRLGADSRLSRERSRGRNPETYRNRTPETRNRSQSREYRPGGPWCYYHYRFGGKADNCRKPCSWRPNFVRTRSSSPGRSENTGTPM